MCGRFTQTVGPEELRERFQVVLPDGVVPRFNVAPTQQVLVVREQADTRRALLARWGLLPHWARDERRAPAMINARAETLAGKPAYRALLENHRCLVVADGFYEWRAGLDGRKQPLRFRLASGEPFGFAGLWAERTDTETGEIVTTCTIVTTRPNALVRPVHDRMPVILTRDAEAAWLDTGAPRHALALLRPLDAALMVAEPASFRVNSVRNDDAGLLVPDAVEALF